MRYPLPAVIFFTTYYVVTLLPQKLGRKASFTPSVTHDTYAGADLVGRFRYSESVSVSKPVEDGL